MLLVAGHGVTRRTDWHSVQVMVHYEGQDSAHGWGQRLGLLEDA